MSLKKHLLYFISLVTLATTCLAMEQMPRVASFTIICGPEGNQEKITLNTKEELEIFDVICQTEGTIKNALGSFYEEKLEYEANSLNVSHVNSGTISDFYLPMTSTEEFKALLTIYKNIGSLRLETLTYNGMKNDERKASIIRALKDHSSETTILHGLKAASALDLPLKDALIPLATEGLLKNSALIEALDETLPLKEIFEAFKTLKHTTYEACEAVSEKIMILPNYIMLGKIQGDRNYFIFRHCHQFHNKIFDIQTKECIFDVDEAYNVHITKNDHIFYICSKTSAIKIIDLKTKTTLGTLNDRDEYIYFVLSPDEKYLAALNRNQYLEVWDTQSKTMIGRKRGYVDQQYKEASPAFSCTPNGTWSSLLSNYCTISANSRYILFNKNPYSSFIWDIQEKKKIFGCKGTNWQFTADSKALFDSIFDRARNRADAILLFFEAAREKHISIDPTDSVSISPDSQYICIAQDNWHTIRNIETNAKRYICRRNREKTISEGCYWHKNNYLIVQLTNNLNYQFTIFDMKNSTKKIVYHSLSHADAKYNDELEKYESEPLRSIINTLKIIFLDDNHFVSCYGTSIKIWNIALTKCIKTFEKTLVTKSSDIFCSLDLIDSRIIAACENEIIFIENPIHILGEKNLQDPIHLGKLKDILKNNIEIEKEYHEALKKSFFSNVMNYLQKPRVLVRTALGLGVIGCSAFLLKKYLTG